MTGLKKWVTTAVLSSWSLASFAIPITDSVGNVDILGNTYAVSILYDDTETGIGVANSFSSLLPDIYFTTDADASAAAAAMSAAFPGFDWNPASTDFSVILGGTRIPFSVVGTDYNYYGIEDDLFGSVAFGPSTEGVDSANRYSFAQFELIDTAPVPAPATLVLFGLGLAGLGWSNRKKA